MWSLCKSALVCYVKPFVSRSFVIRLAVSGDMEVSGQHQRTSQFHLVQV